MRKTWVYWVGLIILAIASIVLFAAVWYNVVLTRYKPPFEWQVPFIVGAAVFVVIEVYMMRHEPETPSDEFVV